MEYLMEKSISKEMIALNLIKIIPMKSSNTTQSNEITENNDENIVMIPVSDFLFIPVNNYLDLLVVTALRYLKNRNILMNIQ